MIFVSVAIALFLLAILVGVMLFTYVIQGKRPPKIGVHSHGALVITGLIFLVYSAIQYNSIFWISAGILLLAACGGRYLVVQSKKTHKVSKMIASIHGLLALSGFIVLIITTLFLVQSS